MHKHLFRMAALAVAALGLVGTARADIIYGVTTATSTGINGANLVFFDSSTPGSVTTVGAFSTGLVVGHNIRAIDFRPATGELWALSTQGGTANAQLYTVNLSNASLTPVGAGLVLTGNTNDRVKMDFNPVADRIRIVTSSTLTTANNNFRANPLTGGLVQADTILDYATGDPRDTNVIQIGNIAYSNNFAGATQTTLYAWDYQNDGLATIGSINGTPNSPNSGIMNTIAQPGVITLNNTIGFEISGSNNFAFVSHDNGSTNGPFSFFTQNLSTGARTLVGSFPSNTFLLDFSSTIAAVPEPSTIALIGVGALGAAGYSLRRFRGRNRFKSKR